MSSGTLTGAARLQPKGLYTAAKIPFPEEDRRTAATRRSGMVTLEMAPEGHQITSR